MPASPPARQHVKRVEAESSARRPWSAAATAGVRMGDAFGDEALAEARTFIRRKAARRSRPTITPARLVLKACER
jgi:hypothetical protein